MEEIEAWLALTRVPNMQRELLGALRERFGSLSAIFEGDNLSPTLKVRLLKMT